MNFLTDLNIVDHVTRMNFQLVGCSAELRAEAVAASRGPTYIGIG